MSWKEEAKRLRVYRLCGGGWRTMARLGNAGNKKRCDRYRAESRRERNKEKKQMKHQRRLAYFAKRRSRLEVAE